MNAVFFPNRQAYSKIYKKYKGPRKAITLFKKKNQFGRLELLDFKITLLW